MMSAMPSPNPKLSIGLEPDQQQAIAEAVRLRASRLGMTKPKMSAILRDVLMAWARDEQQRAGSDSMQLFAGEGAGRSQER